jgi:uncharacterized membrane protein
MYLVAKLFHVASVVIFLGNIITGLYWHAHAVRTRDPVLISHAMAGIIRSDRLFTVPGVVAIIVTGVGLALLGGYPLLHTGWILWSLILFSASGVAFMAQVVPLQRRLLRSAQPGAFQYESYLSLTRRWELWGAVALLTPLAAMALMVLKPSL